MRKKQVSVSLIFIFVFLASLFIASAANECGASTATCGCCCEKTASGYDQSNSFITLQSNCPVSANMEFKTGDAYDSLDFGDGCSCSLETYFVSGTVYMSAGSHQVLVNIQVSAGSRTTTTNSTGGYVLTGIPATNGLLVFASNGSCEGSLTFDLQADAIGKNIPISCMECIPGDCDEASRRRCDDTGKWVSLPAGQSCSQCKDDDNKCPSGCTPATDNDCVPGGSGSASCGNGYIDYPFETCDPSSSAAGFCSDEFCDTSTCNCRSGGSCGNGILEPELGESCELHETCPSTGQPCAACKCNQTCVESGKVPQLQQMAFVKSPRKINLVWGLKSSACDSAVTYNVYRCQKSGSQACNSEAAYSKWLVQTSNKSFSDSENLEQNNEYCYLVKASFAYNDGYVAVSPLSGNCVKTGYELCMNIDDDRQQFCWNNARSVCEANGNIKTLENCGKSVCMGPYGFDTVCSASGACSACNGLYGMFGGYLGFPLLVRSKEGEAEVTRPCAETPGVSSSSVLQGCYYDKTKTLASAFKSCSSVTSCYDYMSQEACEASECTNAKGCEWDWLDSSRKILGGVCRPAETQRQMCEYCSNPKYNWLSFGCTAPVCRLFGNCSYVGGDVGCMDSNKFKSNASCEKYGTAAACGTTPLNINVVYSGGVRISGTNKLTTPSSDTLGLGKCYWDGLNCRRDADFNRGKSGVAPEDEADCPLSDLLCKTDFIPPVTNLTLRIGKYPEAIRISFVASDNRYSGDKVKTFFCIAPFGESCYPATNHSSPYLVTVNGSGLYSVFYYSQDFAKNLEEVRRADIVVDTQPPLLKITSPNESDVTNVPVGQNLTIKGFLLPDSPGEMIDAVLLCTYPLSDASPKSDKKTCLSPCIPGRSFPDCFNITSGEFRISAKVMKDNFLYDQIVYSQDTVGNNWSRTLYGIYKNTIPPKGKIVIDELK